MVIALHLKEHAKIKKKPGRGSPLKNVHFVKNAAWKCLFVSPIFHDTYLLCSTYKEFVSFFPQSITIPILNLTVTQQNKTALQGWKDLYITKLFSSWSLLYDVIKNLKLSIITTRRLFKTIFNGRCFFRSRFNEQKVYLYTSNWEDV